MSELRADTITGSNGSSPVTLTKQSAAKVFSSNKTLSGSTPTWLPDVDSFNVSSTTDTQTGYAIINMTNGFNNTCLLYTSPSPRDRTRSRMPSSA